MRQITLGLSMHRPEMIPIISRQMRRHEAIFLEEPPVAEFVDMLTRNISIDEYLLALDMEYPEFSRAMCHLLRELQREGIQIFQVEPYLEVLVRIHEFFAAGHTPDGIKGDTLEYPVYLAERNATGALLAYYQAAISGTIDTSIAAIEKFARMDAARFRLRDSLRAQALAPLVQKYESAYIEAGAIHFPIWRLLQREVLPGTRVQPLFLADEALNAMGVNGHLYGPGDLLTLLYVFHPQITDTRREQLLAARSIIYSKIIEKEEKIEDLHNYPHLVNELACIRMTNRLSLAACQHLFPRIRRIKSFEARQIVTEYLSGINLLEDRIAGSASE
jgi:hypothetical protein